MSDTLINSIISGMTRSHLCQSFVDQNNPDGLTIIFSTPSGKSWTHIIDGDDYRYTPLCFLIEKSLSVYRDQIQDRCWPNLTRASYY